MVTLDIIRQDLHKKLEADQSINYVEVRADTLEEALADAAVQLNTRQSTLEYEVVERGSAGFMGLAKIPFIIRVYENAEPSEKKIKKDSGIIISEEEFEEEQAQIAKDGYFYVHYFDDNVVLKVALPEGAGKAVSSQDVISAIRREKIESLDEKKIAHCVKNGTNNEYEVVGFAAHDSSADAIFKIDVAADEMSAIINATPPSENGSEISSEKIKKTLKAQGVLDGYKTDLLMEFVDKPVYGKAVVVVRGNDAVDGHDAYIAYNFETDSSKLRIKETEDGSVNFKELNMIQNVVQGQPLAQKIPAEQGKNGLTLYGKYITAKNGKDVKLPLGRNVKLDSDGLTIVAETNGQVMLVGDKINVEPIMQVDGDVSVKTGNIKFLGTVLVKGNVEDGYDITASGNIEIAGTVGKSRIEAEGDVNVALGVNGRNEGYIRTGKSLYAKFLQNVQVDVGENIFVTDGIVNSEVVANKKVVLQGKRASIIGGHIFATEEVNTKNLGSGAGGTETIVEVGFDPKAKKRLDELIDRQSALVRELDELELNIQTLENQKKVKRSLTPDKEEYYEKLLNRKNEITDESTSISAEIQEIQERLRNLKVVGKVSVSGTVYAGVKIYVRDAKDDVRTEVKAVTFYYEDGLVRRGKYEALDESTVKKGPDGVAAN
ncbi:MAG: FapA family protein [Treponemataceae bacterium]|nr:MAG: FapA family protein [Treponemataceae bacterium]